MSTTGIHHYQIQQDTSLLDFLRGLGHSTEEIDHWLYRGCVFIDGQRHRTDCTLTPQQVIRLHTRPKRYHWIAESLKSRIVYEEDDFLVLNKPAGLPVHATLDNFVENAKFILEAELGRPLYSTHRLDIPTSGLLLFAKNKPAQTTINGLFARRQVEKLYLAVIDKPVPLGPAQLFIDGSTRVPRAYSFTPFDGWWDCRLTVIDCTERKGLFHSKIQLETGRTHQIRAQLAALGAPIVGDSTYGSVTPFEPGIGLSCQSLAFRYQGRSIKVERHG